MKKRVTVIALIISLITASPVYASESEMSYDELLEKYEQLKSDYDELLEATSNSEQDGESQKAQKGFEDVVVADYTFSLNGVEQYNEISSYFDQVKTPDKDGDVYLLLDLEVANNSSEDGYINIFYSAGYVDGYAIDPSLDSIKDKDDFCGDVAAGRKRTGYKLFEIPNNWEEFEYVYIDKSRNINVSFIITPDDIQRGSEEMQEYTSDIIEKVQEALNAAGYNCGTPDGIAGSGTSGQIEKYQTDKGLTVTGTITDEVLEALGV